MFLRITNKTVSFTSCPFVSFDDICFFHYIKQLLRLAVITNVWIVIFAWTTFIKVLSITNLHDIASFKTLVMFQIQWLVIFSQYVSVFNFPWNVNSFIHFIFLISIYRWSTKDVEIVKVVVYISVKNTDVKCWNIIII